MTLEQQADQQEKLWQAAAEAAALVEPGMVVGFGEGATVAMALRLVAQLQSGGKLVDIACVPSSLAMESRAQALGLRTTRLTDRPRVDLTIDEAREVDPELNVIKDARGALLRQKMLAQASRREVVIIDEAGLSLHLGTRTALPVEVIEFGWRSQEIFLRDLGANPVLRMEEDQPVLSDEGHLILDCHFGPMVDPRAVAARLDARAGIAVHGLFVDMATEVIVCRTRGIRHMWSSRRD